MDFYKPSLDIDRGSSEEYRAGNSGGFRSCQRKRILLDHGILPAKETTERKRRYLKKHSPYTLTAHARAYCHQKTDVVVC